MYSTDGAVGRSVVLIDRFVASAIAEPDCWGYEFRVVGSGAGESGGSFRPFAENDFETAVPVAAILSESAAERSKALAGAEATAWGARQGGDAAKLVEMFTAREANVVKNASEPPRPYLLPVRREAIGPDTLYQLATLAALQRRELDAWIDGLMREKVSLKIENENLHETLSDFQNVFWRIQDTRSLGYEIKVGDGLVALGSDSLTQNLPVPTRGLTDIELHFAHRSTKPFVLDVELIEAETNTVLHRWSRSPRQVGPGWNRLSLPMALAGPRLSGALRLTLREGTAPPLSTSHPTLVERAGVHLGERPLGTPLALRLWQALPGSLNPAFDTDERASWEPLQRSTFDRLSLAPELGARLERDFEIFAKDHHAFRIHPLAGQTLVAIAPVMVDADTMAARVQVQVPDDRAQPTECALAFLPENGPVQLEDIEKAPSFSGWRVLEGGESIALETHLDAEPEGLAHLCFAARLSRQARGQDFSRTHWRTVELFRRRESDGLPREI